MGCFNQTCAVTHMPIVAGDEVACFLLASARSESVEFEGFVGSGAVWQTLSLPFFGTYDDYGSVNDVEPGTGDAINHVVLRKDVADILKLTRETRKPPRMDLKGFWGETDLRLMMVHSEVWHLLTAECRTLRGDKILAHEEAERVPAFLDFVRKQSEDYVKRMMPAGTPVRPFEQAHEALHTWRGAQRKKGTSASVPYVARFFDPMGECGGIHPVLRMGAKAAINKLLMADEPDMSAVTDALEMCLFTQIFDINMSNLRRMWAPQPGLGSQDTSYEMHRAISGWVTYKCAVVNAHEEFDEMVEAGLEA